jgi:V8-like Glu-specific endopeptidase
MAGDPITTFPGDSVVLIESPDPSEAGYYLIGSGVVIGPHTILTASHVVFNTSGQITDQDIVLYPGWDSADPAQGPGYIPTSYTDHFNPIGTYGSEGLSISDTESDYAVIDTSYTFTNWMGVLLNYAGGTVSATGYPATAGGVQTTQVGTVSADPPYSVLGYDALSVSPGNSGGPIWLNYNGSDDVAGIVSTTGRATQLTSADWSQIESWVSQDGYSLSANVAPSVTAVPSASLAVGQSISASSLVASISNPSGDDIANDIFEDLGGGSGYFTVNGVRQADGVWISAGPSENVQYVAGASPGSDTLGVGIFDATSNSNISTSVVATTVYAAPVVTAVPSVSLGEGQSIPASSLMSISNPSGDDILYDLYEDLGGGSGYFTLNGLKYFDGLQVYAGPTDTVQAALWQMDGTSVIASAKVNPNPGPSWTLVGTGDFNGDGQSDLLWQNTSGQAAIWEMDGTSVITSAKVGPNPGPSWKVVGTGDFNGDGNSDLLWQNTDGQAAIWEMDGTNVIDSEKVGPNPGPSWKLVGTGDFNGDGKSDLLWQNTSGQVAIWEMDGTNVIDSAKVDPNPGPSWKLIGTGDFNGDGKSDLLWQNTSGQVAIWEMDGTNVIDSAKVGLNPGPSWKVVGTGDFNGDGFSDILWQNTSGQAAIWEMDGTNVVSSEKVVTNPGPSWHAIGTGAGGSDILLQNTSGQASIWEMNGNAIAGGGPISVNPGSSWGAVGLT